MLLALKFWLGNKNNAKKSVFLNIQKSSFWVHKGHPNSWKSGAYFISPQSRATREWRMDEGTSYQENKELSRPNRTPSDQCPPGPSVSSPPASRHSHTHHLAGRTLGWGASRCLGIESWGPLVGPHIPTSAWGHSSTSRTLCPLGRSGQVGAQYSTRPLSGERYNFCNFKSTKS